MYYHLFLLLVIVFCSQMILLVGLQTRCAAVFAQLSEASCPSDNPTPDANQICS